MNIYAIGLNYRTAPLEIREKLSINRDEQVELLARLGESPGVAECVTLSTCNRTEAYLYSADHQLNISLIEREICRFKQLSPAEYQKYFYNYYGIDAVKHLFKVTSGLDSLIFGENQILGQVKRAFETALKAGSSGAILNTLFREAVTTAKLLKNATRRSHPPVSLAQLVVEVARKQQDETLANQTAVLIGTGEIGQLVLKELIAAGIKRIWITSRNRARLAALTGRHVQTCAFAYSDRYRLMNTADWVISATASPHYTVVRDRLEQALHQVKRRVFIDLAVPRDMDETIADLPGVVYLNLDRLPEAAGTDWEARRLVTLQMTQLLDQRVLEFERWYAFRNVLPLMRAVQASTDGYIEATLAKLGDIGPQEQALVRRSMRNLANHLLNKCFYNVRETVSSAEASAYFNCLGKSLERED